MRRQTPASVMNGEKGLKWQMKDEATRLDVQHFLLMWLRGRRESPELRAPHKTTLARLPTLEPISAPLQSGQRSYPARQCPYGGSRSHRLVLPPD